LATWPHKGGRNKNELLLPITVVLDHLVLMSLFIMNYGLVFMTLGHKLGLSFDPFPCLKDLAHCFSMQVVINKCFLNLKSQF